MSDQSSIADSPRAVRALSGQRGQTTVEYVGLMPIVSATMAVVVASPLSDIVIAKVDCAVEGIRRTGVAVGAAETRRSPVRSPPARGAPAGVHRVIDGAGPARVPPGTGDARAPGSSRSARTPGWQGRAAAEGAEAGTRSSPVPVRPLPPKAAGFLWHLSPE